MFEIDLAKVDKQKDYPEFCSVCRDVLTSEDRITKRIKRIESKYQNSKKNTGKRSKKSIHSEVTKLNEVLKLGMTQIKHDKCEGISQYCAYDGEKLGIYGFSITEEGHKTNLSCGLCRHTYSRDMTPQDAMRIKPVDIIGQALIGSYRPRKALA